MFIVLNYLQPQCNVVVIFYKPLFSPIFSYRRISRHKETKLSRRRGDAPIPKPDILQSVSMQQYQDMEQVCGKLRVKFLEATVHLKKLALERKS